MYVEYELTVAVQTDERARKRQKGYLKSDEKNKKKKKKNDRLTLKLCTMHLPYDQAAQTPLHPSTHTKSNRPPADDKNAHRANDQPTLSYHQPAQ